MKRTASTCLILPVISSIFIFNISLLAAETPNTAPVAAEAAYIMAPGEQASITLSATDIDADTLSYIITALPTSGTVVVGTDTLTSTLLPYTLANNGSSLKYTAASDASGSFTLKYKANDGTADSNAATLTLTVNRAPQPVETIFFTEPNTALSFDLPVTDSANDTLSFQILSLPGHGQITAGSDPLTDADLPFDTDKQTVTYTPDTDFHGPDSFTFSADDGLASTTELTANLQVNTTPVPDDLEITVRPDDFTLIQLQATDADRDTIRYVIVSLPAHGALTLGRSSILENQLPLTLEPGVDTVEYAVTSNYRGTDSFHYRATDSYATSSRATVLVAVNSAPQAKDQQLNVLPGGSLEGTLNPTDDDGDTLTIQITALPTLGSLEINGRSVSGTDTIYDVAEGGLSFTYTPDVAEEEEEETDDSTDTGDESSEDDTDDTTAKSALAGNSVDSFSWVAMDDKESSEPAKVIITIYDGSDNDPDDDQVAGDDNAPTETLLCGAVGAADALLAFGFLVIAPARRKFFVSPG